MAERESAREAKRETVSPVAIAERLCVAVYENGKAAGRYAMPYDDVVTVTRLTFGQVASGLGAALRRDWCRRDKGNVVLKAAGLHIAKKALGLLT